MTNNNNKFPEGIKRGPVLAVAPLNSVPYIGPSTTQANATSKSDERASNSLDNDGPAMIFMPSGSSTQEWEQLVAQTTTGVALTGSAALGQIGPTIGLVDVAESEDSYCFRVSLPGVARDEKSFSCDVEPDGKVLIKGVTTTGEKIVCKHSQVFKMQTQNLCPPGHFTVSFKLPGPVNHEEFVGEFGAFGILEGRVKKR